MLKQIDFAGRVLLRNTRRAAQPSFRIPFRNRHFHSSSRLLAEKNYYDVLGVEKNSDEKTIKQAFFKAAKKFHPDTNPDDPNATDKFAEVNNAYQVLSDKNKRAEYDMFGTTTGPSGGTQQQQQGGGFPGAGFEGQNLQDIFENLFGMGQKQKRGSGSAYGAHKEPGNDLQVEIDIKFDDCLKEVKRDLRLNMEEKCGTCSGSGIKAGTSPKKCVHCQGSGMMSRQQGFMIMQTTCPYCHGEGVSVEHCVSCDGQGLTAEKKTVSVTIPAGIEDGMRVRIPNQGGAARSKGPRGHLYVFCRVNASQKFERIGADVHVKMVVPLSMALLGGELTVPIPGSRTYKHTIKSGTQSGHIETVRGKGFPDPRNGMNGHLYIHVNVHIPSGLDDKSKELIEEFKNNEVFKEPRAEKPDVTHNKRNQGKQKYGFGGL